MEKIISIYENLEPNSKVQIHHDHKDWDSIYIIFLDNWEDLNISDFNIKVAMFLNNSDLTPVIIRTTEIDLKILTIHFLYLPDPEYNLAVLKKKVLLSIEKFSVINKSFFTCDEFWELMMLFWKYCQYTENWYGAIVLQRFYHWDRVAEIFEKFPKYRELTDSENSELWNTFSNTEKKCILS